MNDHLPEALRHLERLTSLSTPCARDRSRLHVRREDVQRAADFLARMSAKGVGSAAQSQETK